MGFVLIIAVIGACFIAYKIGWMVGYRKRRKDIESFAKILTDQLKNYP